MNGRGISIASLIIAILALVLAIGMPIVMPAPEGEVGPEGPQGPAGADGVDGSACWDLNGNGVPDLATEDVNGDSVVDILDCTGPQGPPGPGSKIFNGSLDTVYAVGDNCGQVNGLEVTVPEWVITMGDTVVVTVTAQFRSFHVLNDVNYISAYISTAPDDCTNHAGKGHSAVHPDLPDGVYTETVTFQRVFYWDMIPLGPRTFYVNSWQEEFGQPEAFIFDAIIVAIVYPG